LYAGVGEAVTSIKLAVQPQIEGFARDGAELEEISYVGLKMLANKSD